MHTLIHTYITCIPMSVCKHSCMYAFIYVCMYVHTYVYMYICICMFYRRMYGGRVRAFKVAGLTTS